MAGPSASRPSAKVGIAAGAEVETRQSWGTLESTNGSWCGARGVSWSSEPQLPLMQAWTGGFAARASLAFAAALWHGGSRPSSAAATSARWHLGQSQSSSGRWWQRQWCSAGPRS